LDFVLEDALLCLYLLFQFVTDVFETFIDFGVFLLFVGVFAVEFVEEGFEGVEDGRDIEQ
jgi:hypothetical protein